MTSHQPQATGRKYDISNCDREPIHVPGAIQPHGLLFALNEADHRIEQVSDNIASAIAQPIEHLVGQSFFALLEARSRADMETALQLEDLTLANPLSLAFQAEPEAFYDGIVHRHQGVLIVELERRAAAERPKFAGVYQRTRSAVARLRNSRSVASLCNAAARDILQMTGMDRVMIYAFDEDWNGSVVAEARSEGDQRESFLHHHFPASDIPRQARDLYTRNWLRIIPSTNYEPSRLVPERNPRTGQPLDLSFAVLRNVSPIHLEYSRNMGLQASMSISLMRDERLWGLISCISFTAPNYVPFDVRSSCEFLGSVVSSLLLSRQEIEEAAARARARETQQKLVDMLSKAERLEAGMEAHQATLLDMVKADGAALYFRRNLSIFGDAPPASTVTAFIAWLREQHPNEVFCTDALMQHAVPPDVQAKMVPGVLAVPLSRTLPHHYLLWFRQEVVKTITWSGNPNKPVEEDDHGQMRIHPRKSFEAWKETVRERSAAWMPYEIHAAEELRGAILDVVLARAERMEKLNHELERSNLELDSFAYAASHDLKEPLRGIFNYLSLSLREGDDIPKNVVTKLNTSLRLAKRMDGLLDALLAYAQVGRAELALEETDLSEVVAQVFETMKLRLEENHAELRVPEPLPAVRCDRILVAQVLTNLITNALKYNESTPKWVELGAAEQDGDTVFYVRHNGIGIPLKHRDAIFTIFKRLHGKEAYGGGTGTGLTITRGIIERHGGRIWFEPTPGGGTTFKFTLQRGAN